MAESTGRKRSEVGRARRPAQQARSRETERAILTAVRELLAERSYDELAMNQIAELAGISIGGLYGRFPGGKPGLLIVLFRELLEEWCEELERRLPDREEGRLSIEEVVGRYVQAMVQAFYADRTLVRAALRAGASKQIDPAILEQALAFDARAHERFYRFAGAALRGPAAAAGVEADQLEAALRFSLLQLSASGRSAVVEGSTGVYRLPADPEKIAAEITTGAIGYLKERLGPEVVRG